VVPAPHQVNHHGPLSGCVVDQYSRRAHGFPELLTQQKSIRGCGPGGCWCVGWAGCWTPWMVRFPELMTMPRARPDRTYGRV